MNWYKISQQQDFDFYDSINPTSAPVDNQPIVSISDLDSAIEDAEDISQLISILNYNGVDYEIKQLLKEKVLTIWLGDKLYIIDDFMYPESKEVSTWIDELFEHELYSYIQPKEESFWDEVQSHFTVYHATSSEKLPDIMQNGLEPRDETRGVSNRGTGSAIFTSENPDDIDSYGDTVLQIHVGQMKADGYTPQASRETPIEESRLRQALAHQLGYNEYESNEYGSEGIYDTTVVFYDAIPAKYITIT